MKKYFWYVLLFAIFLFTLQVYFMSNIARTEDSTEDLRPVPDFNVNPSTGTAPLRVQLTNTSSGEIVKYIWRLSDGRKAYLDNPAFTFDKPGKYTVQLTITDSQGKIYTRERTIIVKEPQNVPGPP